MVRINNKNLLKNMGFSALYKPISILISFIYVPIALNYLGSEKYGIWATILSVLSWISYFDIGLGNGMRNKLAEALANRDYEKSKRIVSSSYFVFGIILLIVLVFFGFLIVYLPVEKIFNYNVPDVNLRNLLFTSVLFAVINFWISLCKSIFYALQKAHISQLIGIFSQLATLITVFILSKIAKPNILYVAFAYGISNITFEILFSIILFSKHRELIPSLSFFDKKIALDTMNLGSYFFIIQISALILFNTDNLIISNRFGPEYVTYYSTVNKVFTGVTSIVSAFITPLWSAFTVANAKKKYEWIKKIIKFINYAIIPIALLLLILSRYFYPLSVIWLGRQLEYPNGLIILMSVYSIVHLWCQAYSMITNGVGLLKIPMIVSIIQGVVNIPLSLILSSEKLLGFNGVLTGTIISLLISGITIPIYVHYWINKKINSK